MNKQSLILLHGALGSADQFDTLASLLDSDFEIHRFNLPGHGGKVCQEDFSCRSFATDVFNFMEINHIDRSNIFGYSMGGYVALQLAMEHPERTGKIMTLGTKFDWNPETSALEMQKLNPELITEKVPQFAKSLASRHAPVPWEEVVRKTSDMIHRLGNGDAIDFSTDLIRNEVLITVGELDNMVTREESEAIVEMLDNASFMILPGTKHPFEKVDTALLAERIRNFMTG